MTPGKAEVAPAEIGLTWSECRFLKATADDVARPPHALEYVLDYRLDRPGLKAFRVIAVRMRGGELEVLPGVDATARPVSFCQPLDGRLAKLPERAVALAFAYLEPWGRHWTLIDLKETDSRGCLQHLLTWADFQAEIRGLPPLERSDLRSLEAALAAADIDAPPSHEVLPDLPTRALNEAARALVKWLRYKT
jgi:hypothetical protein